MNIAVIDLGTNTFNLLIVKVEKSTYTSLVETKEFVQLGRGGINNQLIQEDAFERGLHTLERFHLLTNEHSCDKTIAIATSAIRNASNGKEFCQKSLDLYGIEIQTIDGNKEADYIYHGAKQAVDLKEGISLIMDVGGGSTEFIVCNNKEVLWKQSFEVGAARLLEGFHHSNPIAHLEINNIEKHLQQVLKELIIEVQKHKIQKLVGCSGAFSSFVSMINHVEDNEDDQSHFTNYEIKLNQFNEVHKSLLRSTLEERLEIKGLIKQRAPMIVVGSILVNYIIKKLGVNYFEYSKYALKEGVIYQQLNNI